MRDFLKDSKYWSDFIMETQGLIEQISEWIRTGKTPVERVSTMKQQIAKKWISLVIAKYSAGYPIGELVFEYKQALELIYESWDGFWKFRDREGKVFNQYILSAYDEMVWMLSLGVLLNIGDEQFRKLVSVVDRDKVKDILFEFIISAKIKDRQPLDAESYEKYFWIPQTFSKLRDAIRGHDNTESEKLLLEFIKKDWYRNHKDVAWYDSHKRKNQTYFGYWSFETAAIVKIKRLNDSDLRSCKYYPGDLVQFEAQ